MCKKQFRSPDLSFFDLYCLFFFFFVKIFLYSRIVCLRVSEEAKLINWLRYLPLLAQQHFPPRLSNISSNLASMLSHASGLTHTWQNTSDVFLFSPPSFSILSSQATSFLEQMEAADAFLHTHTSIASYPSWHLSEVHQPVPSGN